MISNEVTFGEKFFTKFLQPTEVTCRHYSSTSTYSRKLAVSGIVTTDTIKASAVKLKLLERGKDFALALPRSTNILFANNKHLCPLAIMVVSISSRVPLGQTANFRESLRIPLDHSRFLDQDVSECLLSVTWWPRLNMSVEMPKRMCSRRYEHAFGRRLSLMRFSALTAHVETAN
uniref:Uncharacterized protein n=1 Tax=Vespula pensylvanica TaxID=30213 RepID=A0A834UA58_VESPE|nr:hypothetical protein H0235_008047 [Vespula pensylvanica]